MCLTIPKKVISKKGKKVVVADSVGRKKEVKAVLTKVKIGDFVILQNNSIINKLAKKEAENLFRLLEKHDQK